MSVTNSSETAGSLNCIDLFAGAGGFSLAAQRCGYDVRLAIESDKHAAMTFADNIPKGQKNPPIIKQLDISNICPIEARSEVFGRGENCDLLLGGPPCQGFSTHRFKDAGVQDTRNELIFTYFNFVRAFKPTAFLMENVPGMLWERHRPYLEKFYDVGRKSGYELFDPVVVDARDYGLPQRRKRVFILGLIKSHAEISIAWPPPKSHGNADALEKDSSLKPWVNCKSVFTDPVPNDANNNRMKHGPELIAVFKKTPINGGSRKDSGRTLSCHKSHDGHKDVYGRINPSQPAPTMTTACINPSKGRFVHPTKHHGITVRQAARIQTFPDEFTFCGGLIAAGKQIGNAVPVKLGEILISHLTREIFERKGEIAKAA